MHFPGGRATGAGGDIEIFRAWPSWQLPDHETRRVPVAQRRMRHSDGAMRKRNGSDNPRFATGTHAPSLHLVQPARQNPRSLPEIKSRAPPIQQSLKTDFRPHPPQQAELPHNRTTGTFCLIIKQTHIKAHVPIPVFPTKTRLRKDRTATHPCSFWLDCRNLTRPVSCNVTHRPPANLDVLLIFKHLRIWHVCCLY